MVQEPIIEDDVLKNKIAITHSYKIDSIWQPMALKPNFIGVEFAPYSLTDVLYLSNLENRKNEISLPYPVSREHITKVILPQQWRIEENYDIVSNDIFYYDFDVKYNKKKKELQLKSYLKIQKPLISKDEFTTYYNDLNKLDKTFGYTVYIPKDATEFQENNILYSFGKVVFISILIIGIIVLLVFLLQKRTHNKI